MKGRRVIFPELGRAVVEDFDVPPLKAGCVLIESQCSVISPGTELAWDAPSIYRRLIDRESELLGVVFRWNDTEASQ